MVFRNLIMNRQQIKRSSVMSEDRYLPGVEYTLFHGLTFDSFEAVLYLSEFVLIPGWS